MNRNLVNPDDVHKTVFCIPYEPIDDGQEEHDVFPPLTSEHNDLENGQELRLLAYREAWGKCLSKMQKIIFDLQALSVDLIVSETKSSYLDSFPGLPYPELPVISVTNPAFGSNFLHEVTSALQKEAEHHSLDKSILVSCAVIHLYPGEFSNLANGMKSIVSGFIEQSSVLNTGKRKPTESLATHDIKLLVAWYKAWLESLDRASNHLPNLVVVLHDFEQYDPLIMQDVFHICSKYIPQLPLVFLVSMTSTSSNYLTSTYPQATLALLRVRNFVTPAGLPILQEILLKTFFDVNFEPDVMIGPTVLNYLYDYFLRYHSSVDAIFTILQLAHLRHFMSEPLTVLTQRTLSYANLPSDSSGWMRTLRARIALHTADEDVVMDGLEQNIPEPLPSVDTFRRKYYKQYRNLRIGFGILLLCEKYFRSQGYNSLDWFSAPRNAEPKLRSMMTGLLTGQLEKEIHSLGKIIKLLNAEELHGLSEELHKFFFDMDIDISSTQLEPRSRLIAIKHKLSSQDFDAKEHARELSDFVLQYLEGLLSSRLEEVELWEIWYTGFAPFPSEILNPSIRASMLAGLLRPHDFATDPSSSRSDQASNNKPIWELPDISILFKRYLDSAKMINVYDWFESFKSVLESQRQHLQEQQAAQTSPKKRGRGKAAMPKSQEAHITEEEEEKWNVQVQARFIRALHELDYLGFIKHTGRKADHLLRTVFDVNDAE